MTHRQRLQVAQIAIGSLVLFACSEPAAPPPSDEDRPLNVLLITVDTLRADHLGCYGYDRPTSPRIDALAEESLVFDDAQATSSWTLPSLVSLMTSVYPSSHGCVKRDIALGDSFETLAEKLRDEGYYTGGIVSQAFASRRYGLDRGFQSFDDDLAELSRGHELFKKTSQTITGKAEKWLKARAAEPDPRPWFLWLHYFDPHVAYVSHAGYSEQFGTKEELDLYDGEIAWTDFHVGRVLDVLGESGLDEHTLIVFTSDHGEEFSDHGGLYHRNTLYREVLHVPLIVRVPQGERGRTNRPTSLVDVAPTILELADVSPPPRIHGNSALASEGSLLPKKGSVLAELTREDGSELFAAIIGDQKWITGDETALGFTRESDPLELSPIDYDDEILASVRRITIELKSYTAIYSHLAGPRIDAALTPEELDALRGLGYAGEDD